MHFSPSHYRRLYPKISLEDIRFDVFNVGVEHSMWHLISPHKCLDLVNATIPSSLNMYGLGDESAITPLANSSQQIRCDTLKSRVTREDRNIQLCGA